MDNIRKTKTPFMITRYAINSYARATDNHHPIYIDAESAAEWGLSRTVAPSCFFGQLAFSKIILAQEEYIPTGGVHIKQKYKFIKPVFEGDKISVELNIVKYLDTKDRNILEYHLNFINQNGEQVAQSIMTNLLNVAK